MNSAFSFVRNHTTRMKRTPATMTVLVVDDEEPVRKFVERVLREAGYKTATAGGRRRGDRDRRRSWSRSTSWSPT